MASALALLVGIGGCEGSETGGPSGPISIVAVSGDTQTGTVGRELTSAIIVRVVDAANAPVSGQSVSFRVTAGGGTVFAGAAISNANGHATERWTLGPAAGLQHLEARTVDSHTGAAIVSSFGATAEPDSPASVLVTGGHDQTAPRLTTLPAQIAVRVVDRYGNGVPAVSVAFVPGENCGSASPPSVTTAADGSASTTWTLGNVNGAQTLEARVAALAGATVTATGAAFTESGWTIADRTLHSATLLADGRVLLVGGAINLFAELYDPAAGAFSATAGPPGSLPQALMDNTATLLPDGTVLVLGGAPMIAQRYDPITGAFSSAGQPVRRTFEGRAQTALQDGRVLIAGGMTSIGTSIAGAELYDPSTGIFTATGPMGMSRGHHTATLLPDGKVLVAGGVGLPSSGVTAELYDPATGTFAATGSMTTSRSRHVATLLQNGKVLVAGGDSRIPPSAEIYDPATGTFSGTGDMIMSQTRFAAVLLPDGNVLFTGGLSAEIYDPSIETFSSIGTTIYERSGHTMTLLRNGHVLIAGGGGAPAELYK